MYGTKTTSRGYGYKRNAYPVRGTQKRTYRKTYNRPKYYPQKAVVQQNQSYTKKEVKYIDRFQTLIADNDMAFLKENNERVPINGIQEGKSKNQREGRLASMKSLHCKATFKTTAQSDIEILDPLVGLGKLEDVLIRFMIVLDTQTNGAAPLIKGGILDNSGTGGCYYWYRNLEWTSRYRVLADESILIKRDAFVEPKADDTAFNTGAGPKVFNYSFNTTFKPDVSIAFTGSDDQIGSIGKNSIFAMACVENHEKVGDVSIEANFRVRYCG